MYVELIDTLLVWRFRTCVFTCDLWPV